eukprot:scaffold650398_cov51-Prasinocladus_malaysianus.AAC.1
MATNNIEIRTVSGFKAGRADIMRALGEPVPEPDSHEEDILKAYSSEQHFGFYTSYSDFAHLSLVHKGS